MEQLPIQLQKYLKESNITEEEFTSQERLVLNKIVSDFQKTGQSKLLDSLYMEDYEEIPISFNQFIDDPFYLGSATDNGTAIWPAWRQEMNYIFDPLNQIYLSMFSGPIGVGKSTVACWGIDYMLYKLLCLKDPARFHNLAPDERIGVGLFNITLSKGYGVAFEKINTALKKSPWFLKHGEIIGSSDRTSIFYPEKGVTIGVGSSAEHFIGLNTYCITGDTKILTEYGIQTARELSQLRYPFRVVTVTKRNTIAYSDYTTCSETDIVNELYVMTLEDGSVLKCTGNHKFLKSDNHKYKMVKKLSPGDCIETLQGACKIISIQKNLYDYKVPVYDIIDASPNNNFIIDTDSSYVITHNCMMMDETDFKDTKEMDLTKMKSYDAWTSLFRRMESRFMNLGQIPGMAFLVSSAKHEDAFLSQMKEIQRGKPGTYILEKPYWEMVRQERYCGRKFNLVVSNISTDAFIVENNEDLDKYDDDKFEIYKVPIEHLEAFSSDIQGAMRDILGRASKVASRFLNQTKVEEAINPAYKNCFSTDLISLGELDDGVALTDFIELKNINPKLIHYPLFIHHDLSLGAADNAGFYITAVANDVLEESLSQDNEYNTWKFLPVGWCRFRAEKRGSQIPLFKIREGVRELRDRFGFNIVALSADGYQSADMLQQYQLMGFTTYLISMDKPPSNGYMFFRSSLYSKKIILPDDAQLHRELIKLVENKAQGKVDHLAGEQKDQSDACAGSIYCSIVHHQKSKVSIFADGGYLYADVVLGTNEKPVNVTKEMVNADVESAMQSLSQGLFNNLDVDDDNDIFSIL